MHLLTEAPREGQIGEIWPTFPIRRSRLGRHRGSQNQIVIVVGLMIALVLPLCHLGGAISLGKAYSGVLDHCLAVRSCGGRSLSLLLLYVLLVERTSVIVHRLSRAPGVLNIVLARPSVSLLRRRHWRDFPFLCCRGGGLNLWQHDAAGNDREPFWFRLPFVTRAAFVEETAVSGLRFRAFDGVDRQQDRCRFLLRGHTVRRGASWWPAVGAM